LEKETTIRSYLGIDLEGLAPEMSWGRVRSRRSLLLRGGLDAGIDGLVVGDARGQIMAGKHPVE